MTLLNVLFGYLNWRILIGISRCVDGLERSRGRPSFLSIGATSGSPFRTIDIFNVALRRSYERVQTAVLYVEPAGNRDKTLGRSRFGSSYTPVDQLSHLLQTILASAMNHLVSLVPQTGVESTGDKPDGYAILSAVRLAAVRSERVREAPAGLLAIYDWLRPFRHVQR